MLSRTLQSSMSRSCRVLHAASQVVEKPRDNVSFAINQPKKRAPNFVSGQPKTAFDSWNRRLVSVDINRHFRVDAVRDDQRIDGFWDRVIVPFQQDGKLEFSSGDDRPVSASGGQDEQTAKPLWLNDGQNYYREPKVPCPGCGKRITASHVLPHMKTACPGADDEMIKNYRSPQMPCPQCGKKLAAQTIWEHLNKTCPEVGDQDPRAIEDLRVPCPGCEKPFSAGYVKRHMIRTCSNGDEEMAKNYKSPKTTCSRCGKEMVASRVAFHQKSYCRGEDARKSKVVKGVSVPCPGCEKLIDADGLRAHMKIVCTKTDEEMIRNYKYPIVACPRCGKEMSAKSVRDHISRNCPGAKMSDELDEDELAEAA